MTSRATRQMLFWLLVTLELLVMAGCGLAGAWVLRRFFPPCGQPPEDPNVVIIVSDCTRPHLTGISSDGQYMTYYDDRGYWLKNLITGEETSHSERYWLNDTLALEYTFRNDTPTKYWLYDATDDTHISITRLDALTWEIKAVPVLKSAETVYYRAEDALIVALGKDYKAHPENNYMLFIGSEREAKELADFINDNDIPHLTPVITRPSDTDVFLPRHYGSYDNPIPSHNGQFMARGSEIADLQGNSIVIYREEGLGIRTSVAGWAHDDSGVYFQPPRTGGPVSVLLPLLLSRRAPPILKLKLPDQYLSPEALQAEQERQAKEQAQRTWQAAKQWGMVGVVGAAIIAFIIVVQRWAFNRLG